MNKNQNIKGYILIDKPCGWTSFDCVSYVKRKYRFQKAGHAGALDPIASGLIIIMVNNATTWFDLLQKKIKIYEATLILGLSFDTQDITGNLIKFKEPDSLPDEKEVIKVLKCFEGETMQVPPAYSALKVKGKPAYEYARNGKHLVLPARKVFIERIELITYHFPYIRFRVFCKKGFYVRSLCEDIAKTLGCHGVLSFLRRIGQSGHSIRDASVISELSMNPESMLIKEQPV